MTTQKLNRRAVVRTAGWAVPTAALAVTAPALASSDVPAGPGTGENPAPPTDPQPCGPVSLVFGARIDITAPDYSNTNYTAKFSSSEDPANAKMEHWAGVSGETIYWRPLFGFIDGAEAGATLTIPVDPSWSGPSVGAFFGQAGYVRFDGSNTDLMSSDVPSPSVEVTDTAIVFTWSEAIPAGAAGGVVISAAPRGGAEAVNAGEVFFAEGTLDFTPASC